MKKIEMNPKLEKRLSKINALVAKRDSIDCELEALLGLAEDSSISTETRLKTASGREKRSSRKEDRPSKKRNGKHSNRVMQIRQDIRNGKTNKEIEEKYGVTMSAASFHRRKMRESGEDYPDPGRKPGVTILKETPRCGTCHKWGHTTERCNGAPPKTKLKAKKKCSYCGAIGHDQEECFDAPPRTAEEQEPTDEELDEPAEEIDHQDSLLTEEQFNEVKGMQDGLGQNSRQISAMINISMDEAIVAMGSYDYKNYLDRRKK